jgi:TPP-dependent pyruvate/acetoin dehydrogenase alpha subunit
VSPTKGTLAQLEEASQALEALGPKPFPLPLGNMGPVVAGAFSGMKKGDWVVCGMRERVGATLRGCGVERLVDGGAGARPYKVAPSSEAPGARALHAVGIALAEGAPVLCLLGAASAASGSFHEAMNAAALTGAPAIFVVALTELPDDAPVGRQIAASPADLAKAAGLASKKIKNTVTAVKTAVSKARESGEPTLIEVRIGAV